MTIVEPLPDLQWGKGTWQDYISNWRSRDTSWMQEHLILRYQTAAARTTDYPAPQPGHVTYNDTTKSLEMWRGAPTSAWVRSLMFQFLTSNKDDAAGVNISHSSAAGKGIQLTPTSLLVDATTTNFLNGVHTVDATGITVKVGTKTAKLSTDAASLLSDSPISAPSLISTGGVTATGAVSAASISAPAATLTNIGMSGTLSGGIVNGASGLIGGVGMASNVATASGGFVSSAGIFSGATDGAYMRYRNPAGGALGTAFFQVDTANITVGPSNSTGSVFMYPYLRIMQGRGVPWHNVAGTHVAWISPTIVSGGDPGAANYPDGTVWIQP